MRVVEKGRRAARDARRSEELLRGEGGEREIVSLLFVAGRGFVQLAGHRGVQGKGEAEVAIKSRKRPFGSRFNSDRRAHQHTVSSIGAREVSLFNSRLTGNINSRKATKAKNDQF